MVPQPEVDQGGGVSDWEQFVIRRDRRMRELHHVGASAEEIGNELDLDPVTVNRWLARGNGWAYSEDSSTENVNRLRQETWTLAEIATATGLTVSRVRQMVTPESDAIATGKINQEVQEALASRPANAPVARDPLYGTWNQMIDRCRNPNGRNYAAYGGRGISVYEPWTVTDGKSSGFRAFRQWLEDNLGPRPEGRTPRGFPAWTLDRIDVNGNYEPGNLRWADWSTQLKNRRPANGTGHHRSGLRRRSTPRPNARPNSTGYRGVKRCTRRYTAKSGEVREYISWMATLNGKHVGTFKSPEEAGAAWRVAAEAHYAAIPETHASGIETHASGIYALYRDNEIVYIGQSTQLGVRIGDHFRNPAMKKFDSAKTLLLCAREHLNFYETALIHVLHPEYNFRCICG
jgi:hypothetical protein